MPVRFETRDRIALVTLDRPEAMNAIDGEMLRQLDEAWPVFQVGDRGSFIARNPGGFRIENQIHEIDF